MPSTSPKLMRPGKHSAKISIFGLRFWLKHPRFWQSQRSGLYPLAAVIG
jgi:hypothetical protein